MFVLLLIVLPITSAALILIIRLLRPAFAYYWLVAMLGSLSAWILAWLIHPETPFNLPLANWQPRIFLPISPALLIDSKSWPFLIALTTLSLAAMTTDVARPAASRSPRYWFDLVSYLLLTSFSMLAVLSGNLLSLLLSWTLLACIELALRLRWIQDGTQSRGVVTAFALHLAPIGCVIWAGMNAYAAGSPLSFTTISPQLSALLLTAAGISLGIIPLHTPIPKDDPKNAGIIALLRLAPSAPGLALLARVGDAGAPANLENIYLLLAGLGLIYGSLTWAGAPTAQTGISSWIISLASLALASAALGQSTASLAWGVAAIFAGGLYCLATSRLRGLALLWLVTLVSVSALPFSPTWAGAGLYALPFQPLLVILLIGQGMFLAGTLRHALQLPPALSGAERWVGVLYLSGLVLLLISHFVVAWISYSATRVIGQYQIGWIETGISMVALGLAVLAAPFYFRRPGRKTARLTGVTKILELNWLYRLLAGIFRAAERVVASTGGVMEGRAGILWTLLVLALLVSLFVSLGPGG